MLAERRTQRLAPLAQRQVQRGALERPPAVRPEGLLLRRPGREQVEAADQPRELVERPVTRQRQVHREAVVVLRGVRDVLAATLEPAAAQHDRRRHAQEPARDVELATLRRVPVDAERKRGKARVGGEPQIADCCHAGSLSARRQRRNPRRRLRPRASPPDDQGRRPLPYLARMTHPRHRHLFQRLPGVAAPRGSRAHRRARHGRGDPLVRPAHAAERPQPPGGARRRAAVHRARTLRLHGPRRRRPRRRAAQPSTSTAATSGGGRDRRPAVRRAPGLARPRRRPTTRR